MLDQVSHEGRSGLPRQTLNEIVEEFELAWNLDGNADVIAFLPPSDDPAFERVAMELLCVDLERRWRAGHAKAVEEYIRQFPELLNRTDLVEQLAYEEYRLLREHGELVRPADYARRLKVTTKHWPHESSKSAATDSTPLIADQKMRRAALRECVPAESLPGIGDRFLNFELLELLGRGELGEVYLARQPDLANRLVVLKITTELWCESDRLARLCHPHVVPIYSVHQQDKLQAACMPYLGRYTLRDVLQAAADRVDITAADVVNVFAPAADVERFRSEALANRSHRLLDQLRGLSFEHLCLWIMSRIAAGLAHAHERGILHRDLKPANILLTDDGQPMILDFNLSESVSSQRVRVVGGTLPYMAPEHLRAIGLGSAIDERSDLYSLGVILYEILTGHLPFSIHANMDPDGLQAMIAERSVPPVRPSSFNARVTPALDEIVKRCLAPDPKQRYRTAEELHQDLECQLAHQPLRYAANRSIAERVSKWTRRHPRAAAALGVLTISATVLVVVLTLLVRSSDRVDRLEAVDRYEQLVSHAQQARPTLLALDQSELIEIALVHVDQAFALYDVQSANWQQQRVFQLLDPKHQRQARVVVQELFYLLAAEAVHRSGRLGDEEQQTRMLQRALNHNQLAMSMSSDGRNSPGIVRQQATIQTSLGYANQAARLNLWANSLPKHERLDHLLIVTQHMRAREYSQAVDLLLKLDRDWPNDFTVWSLLGRCHYAVGDMAEAAACFVNCSALSPKSAIPHFQIGHCHWRQQNFYAAEQAYAEACRLEGQEPVFLINRAMARMKLKRLDEAIRDLTLAIELGRDDSLPYLLRSRTREAAQDFENAEQDLQRGLQATPVDVQGFNLRGVERWQHNKDAPGALADFESAARLDPYSSKTWSNIAYLHWKVHGRFDDAIAALDKILEVHPYHWETRMTRVLLSAASGTRSEAIREARELVSDAEGNTSPDVLAEVYYYVACSYAQNSSHAADSQVADSDAQEALKWLGKALQIDHKWADVAQIDLDFQPATAHPNFRSLLDAANAVSDLVERFEPTTDADDESSSTR